MAKKKTRKSSKGRPSLRTRSRKPKATVKRRSRSKTISEIGEASSRVVLQAASILEEELAAGVVAAQKVQKSLSAKGRVEPGELDTVVKQLQADGHDVVNVISRKVSAAASADSRKLIGRFQADANAAIDVLARLARTAPEVINTLIERVGTAKKPGKRK